MQDINARIIVAVESAKAEQQAGRLQNGIKGITDARMKDLQVAKAKSKAELAEYKSMIAAQKAYAAEQQLAGAEAIKRIRQRRGAESEELKLRTDRIEQFRGVVLKLRNAEATANLQAYQAKKNYDQLTSGVLKASKAHGNLKKSVKALTDAQIVARTAGRIFGVEINTTSMAMAAGTALVGGLTLAFNLLTKAISYSKNSYSRYREDLSQYEAIHNTVTKGIRERIAAEHSDIEIIKEYGGKADLTKEQSILLADAIKRLSGRFQNLGINIDTSTGNMKSFIRIAGQLEEDARQKKIKVLEKDLELAQQELELSRYKKNTTGFAINPASWVSSIEAAIGEAIFRMSDNDNIVAQAVGAYFLARGTIGERDRYRIGGNKYAAHLKVLENEEKVNNIRKELERLRTGTPADIITDAKIKDAIEARNQKLSELDKQIKIQQLLQKGKNREAEILRIDMELARERRRLTGAEAVAFEKTIASEKRKRIALYDEQQKTRDYKYESPGLFDDIYRQLNQYRSSVQEAVLGGSEREFYLKNRYMMNTDISPMQTTAEGIQNLVSLGGNINRLLGDLDQKLEMLNSTSSQTAEALSNGKIYA